MLRECRGNKTRAAKRLGLSRTQLYLRLQKYGLESRPTHKRPAGIGIVVTALRDEVPRATPAGRRGIIVPISRHRARL